ncbi:MAG: ABC transporter permease subunit [Woeseiaceae bacterium]|nr:ABC transporter permease subunit [Woeseiaceae bacterium]
MRRLVGAVPTLLLVIVLAFFLVHSVPGGPFDSERVLPPEIEQVLLERYDLDDPVPVQLAKYLGNLLKGDFGPSYRSTLNVNQIIAQRFPASLAIGGLAMTLALAAGLMLGTWAALRHNSRLDRVVTGLAMTGISIPIFVVAPALVLIFAVYLNWLPAGWTVSPGPAKYVLPVVALALPQIAYITRLTRASMIDVLQSGYVRTARAQGLGTAAIVRHHALKPALLPVVSYLGPAIAGILTGSVVIESVFGIPGLGEGFVTAAFNRDYLQVMGIVVLYAALVVLLNLLADVLYGLLDPRVRYE